MRTRSVFACLLLLLMSSTDAVAYASFNHPVATQERASGDFLQKIGFLTACARVGHCSIGEKPGRLRRSTSGELFTGEQFDPNVQFYYLRARYYNQANGRFNSMDAFSGRNGDPVTLHKYLFGNDNPVNVIDPSGFIGIIEFGLTLNVLGILAQSSTPVPVGTGNKDLVIAFDGAGGIDNGDNRSFDKIRTRHGGIAVDVGLGNAKALAKTYVKIAAQHYRKNRLGRIMTLGYSRGGNAAVQFANLLAKEKISLYSIVTFDPHSYNIFKSLRLNQTPGNRALNFYQKRRQDEPRGKTGDGLSGSKVIGADNYLFPKGVTHRDIVYEADKKHRVLIDSAFQ